MDIELEKEIPKKFLVIRDKAKLAATAAKNNFQLATEAETLALEAKEKALNDELGYKVTPFKCEMVNGIAKNYIYYGQWGKNTPHGYGVLDASVTNKGYYAGQFRHGYFQGYGVYHFDIASKSLKYSGSFWRDLWHGYGIYEWKNGSLCTGQMKQHEIKGYAVFTRPDGYLFEGYRGNMKENRYGQNLFDKIGIEWDAETKKYNIGEWANNTFTAIEK